jgi:hypothetical protein|tara:strand:+ start:2073 stop:2264 length:192 start_codon:yes stop_codon:yes gene_type:complete
MDSSDPQGWSTTEYKFIIQDGDDDDSSSSDGYSSDEQIINFDKSYKNKTKYKKILTEEELLPE